MSLFKLDPASIVARVHASSRSAQGPTFSDSVFRGAVGFMIVSIAGFLPWVFAGKWLYRNPSELVMYLTCAAVFVSLSGLLLHSLIIAESSKTRGLTSAAVKEAQTTVRASLIAEGVSPRVFSLRGLSPRVFPLRVTRSHPMPPSPLSRRTLHVDRFSGGF